MILELVVNNLINHKIAKVMTNKIWNEISQFENGQWLYYHQLIQIWQYYNINSQPRKDNPKMDF